MEYSYRGLLVRPRQHKTTPPLFVLVAPAKEVKQWAGVKSAADGKGGKQRVVKESRMKAIQTYLDANKRNVVPNSILVCFRPDKTIVKAEGNACPDPATGNYVQLCFDSPDDPAKEWDKAAFVVDGQHRLYAAAEYSESVNVVVTCMLDTPPLEQAFNFIVINTKAIKVDTDIAKTIIADYDGEKLADRLLDVGIRYGKTTPELKMLDNDADSPFRGMLDWDYNRSGDRAIPVTAIEQLLRHTQTSFVDLAEDGDSRIAFLKAVWAGVKSAYPSLWNASSRLMKKVVLAAFYEYLVQRIKVASQLDYVDIYKSSDVTEQAKVMAAKLPSEFWQLPWRMRIQDNANVRQQIFSDLERMAENVRVDRDWYDGLVLPNIEDSDDDSEE